MEREDAREFDISNWGKKQVGISDSEYGELLKRKGVVIVDEIGTKKSKEIVNLLPVELLEHYGAEVTIGDLTLEAYNIRIIHK